MHRRDVPVIVEVALNGATKRERTPHVPIAPAEVAADALACLEAGASIVHQHDEHGDPEGMAADSLAAYREILGVRPDALCYPTTSWGGPIERRWSHHFTLHEAGVLRVAFVDPGSVNLGGADADGMPIPSEFVYTNTFRDIVWKFDQCRTLGLGPSMAIFEPGFLRVALAYEAAGAMPAGAFVKLYFGGGVGYLGGTGGLSFGLPPTRPSLDAYLAMLDGSRLPWAVAVLGGDVVESGMAGWALAEGGHLRVGLEDFAGGPGRTPGNRELVEQAVALCREAGRPVATPDEAAAILGLPARSASSPGTPG